MQMGLIEFKNALNGWERQEDNKNAFTGSMSQLNPDLSQLNPNLSQLNPNLSLLNPDLYLTGYMNDDYVIGDLGFDPLCIGTGKNSDNFPLLRNWELLIGFFFYF